MLKRTLEEQLHKDSTYYPVISVTGPRQSGKTTLVQSTFPSHEYLLLEDPDVREAAMSDPRGFLGRRKGGVILDELQHVPELFSYLQGVVDQDDTSGRFVLTGSSNFLLMEKISQSLAGRTAVRHLLPFAMEELHPGEGGGYPPALDATEPRTRVPPARSWCETLFSGFYPRIHDKGVPPQDWLANYYQTYLQRDVRQTVNVGNLETFRRFVMFCAARSGQQVNYSNLAMLTGISQPTARTWLSILEASFVVMQLAPYHRNFNKRVVKAPKLYFLDPGLLCYLLRIRSPSELEFHSALGAVFESFVVSEFVKRALHRGQEPDLYFWRDSNGREVDLILECGNRQIPVEIKAGQTVRAEALKGLDYWRKLVGDSGVPAALIYGGDRFDVRGKTHVLPWYGF